MNKWMIWGVRTTPIFWCGNTTNFWEAPFIPVLAEFVEGVLGSQQLDESIMSSTGFDSTRLGKPLEFHGFSKAETSMSQLLSLIRASWFQPKNASGSFFCGDSWTYIVLTCSLTMQLVSTSNYRSLFEKKTLPIANPFLSSPIITVSLPHPDHSLPIIQGMSEN